MLPTFVSETKFFGLHFHHILDAVCLEIHERESPELLVRPCPVALRAGSLRIVIFRHLAGSARQKLDLICDVS